MTSLKIIEKINNNIFSSLLVFSLAILVSIMAVVTALYIITPPFKSTFNTYTIGAIGWTTLLLSTISISLPHKKESILIFLIFFIFGFSTGAYLEPVSDQLDHVSRSFERCENIDAGSRFNRSFWQYSMNGLIICKTKKNISYSPNQVIMLIDILHGIYMGIASTILFSIGKKFGLPFKWSFFSVCTAFFFMGTNKFSYFRYYSYGPSFSSILTYWLWVRFFFFENSNKKILIGTFFASLLILIISVNHMQESVFLAYICLFWILLNFGEKIYTSKIKFSQKILTITILFIVLFILPQFYFFQNLIQQISINNLWEANKKVVYSLNNWQIFGRIWESQYRVVETIGVVGFLSLVTSFLLLYWNFENINLFSRFKIFTIGNISFLIFTIPLLHFLWVTNVHILVYYRIVYSSLFWYPIAFFLYFLETRINKNFEKE